MRAKLIVALLGSLLIATIALVAQDIPPDELHWSSRPYEPEVASTSAIRVQSDMVEVPTVVRNARGSAVGNLRKEDFLLFDNGKPQSISIFSVLAGPENLTSPSAGATPSTSPTQPRYVALFFDDVNTTFGNLNFAREGAITFIRKGIDPGERIGIFTASGTVNLDFTDDTQKLLDALAELRLFPRMPDQGPLACPRMGTYEAWEVKNSSLDFYEMRNLVKRAVGCGCTPHPEACVQREADSIVAVAEGWSLDTFDSISHVIRHLSQMPGRRVLVLASSGFLTASLHREQQEVVEAALRANIMINSLSTAAVGGNGMNPISDSLAALADETGGQYVHDNNDLGAGLHILSTVPSTSYVLGFAPENLKADGSLHNLKVKLAQPEQMVVSARPGYYAPSASLSPSEKRFRRLGQSVMAADAPTEIPIQFTATPEALAGGELALKVLVHVDVRKLPFEDLSDRHVERLIFITALFDAKNQFLIGVQGVMDLRLKEATLKQISAQGLDAKLSIQASAGSYRVRQVVQEAVGGHITAISRDVTIH
jgi:VWFA-related protein